MSISPHLERVGQNIILFQELYPFVKASLFQHHIIKRFAEALKICPVNPAGNNSIMVVVFCSIADKLFYFLFFKKRRRTAAGAKILMLAESPTRQAVELANKNAAAFGHTSHSRPV